MSYILRDTELSLKGALQSSKPNKYAISSNCKI